MKKTRTNQGSTASYIPGLDGLRAISIAFVLLTHLGFPDALPAGSFWREHAALVSGSTGVLIFFAISGFLITWLLLREASEHGRIHLARFFARRFLRLFPPLALFFTALILLMQGGWISSDYTAVAFSFCYLYNYVPRAHYVPELGHTWSLGVEEQFYLIWPWVITGIRRNRAFLLLPVLFVLLCLAWMFVHDRTVLTLGGKRRVLSLLFFTNRWFLPACLPLMAGSLAALLLHYRRRTAETLFSGTAALLFSIGSYLAPVYLQAYPGAVFVLQSLGVSCLLLFIYLHPSGLFVRWLEWAPLRFIGRISYGLYLYQGLFLRTGPGGALWIQQFPQNLFLTLAAALLSWFLLEQPLLRYRRALRPGADERARQQSWKPVLRF